MVASHCLQVDAPQVVIGTPSTIVASEAGIVGLRGVWHVSHSICAIHHPHAGRNEHNRIEMF